MSAFGEPPHSRECAASTHSLQGLTAEPDQPLAHESACVSMFTKSARFYDALYHFKDYARAADELRDLIAAHHPTARTLLDVACGTGRHLEHLRADYDVEGLDVNGELLDIARSRCPGVQFHVGDMAHFELARRYDVITCLFSSIAYVKTSSALRTTLRAFARHLNPGGLVVLEPYFGPESYWRDRVTLNCSENPDLKIAWMYVSELRDGLAILDIHYLVGTPAGVETFNEVHELGLFGPDEYRRAFLAAGLRVEEQQEGPFGRGLYIGSAAAADGAA